jgi:endonuclease/exonuclease/phosphatase (EEP) superfamily protein YafD
MIVAGDFNNWSEKRKTIIDGLIKNLALSLILFENENRTIVLGDPIDHILYRGLDPIAHKSHEVTSSDHNPIAVTSRLSRQHPFTMTNNQ